MARNTCPGCGAPYNGKKCRICLYMSMETDISRSEKNVSAQKAAAQKQKQPKTAVSSILGFVIILALVAAVMPSLRSWSRKLDAIDATKRTPEPIPGNPTVLYQHEPITVLVPKQDSTIISLWFFNHSKEDTIVICRNITLNGYRMEDIFLSVYVPADSAVKSTLLELETLADELTFTMEAQKSNGEFLFETAPIYLKERTAVYD